MSHGLQLQSGFMTKHLPEPRRERGGYHYHEVETANHLYTIQVTIQFYLVTKEVGVRMWSRCLVGVLKRLLC